MDRFSIPLLNKPTEAERKTLMLVYGLYALSILPIFLPAMIAVAINHLRVNEVRSRFAKIHHRWLMRTFWFMLLWAIIGGFLSGIGVGIIILGIAQLWYIYRIVRGGLYFLEGKDSLPLPD